MTGRIYDYLISDNHYIYTAIALNLFTTACLGVFLINRSGFKFRRDNDENQDTDPESNLTESIQSYYYRWPAGNYFQNKELIEFFFKRKSRSKNWRLTKR